MAQRVWIRFLGLPMLDHIHFILPDVELDYLTDFRQEFQQQVKLLNMTIYRLRRALVSLVHSPQISREQANEMKKLFSEAERLCETIHSLYVSPQANFGTQIVFACMDQAVQQAARIQSCAWAWSLFLATDNIQQLAEISNHDYLPLLPVVKQRVESWSHL